eukprot:GFKZ01011386.1.p1 GENE.GFKZ01011386.1~~GFKZ01011386.1.p1  ORF type:complete len:872 (+),score=119.49 GFKZ01011386.1:84-2618(+)
MVAHYPISFALSPSFPPTRHHQTSPFHSTSLTPIFYTPRRSLSFSFIQPFASAPLEPTTAEPLPTKRRQRPPNPAPSPRVTSEATRVLVRNTFKRAKAAQRNGDISRARALLRQCLTLDRRDAHSWLALARLESMTVRLNSRHIDKTMDAANAADTARDLFREGLSECPRNVHLLQAWAVLEHRCGDREMARKLFAKGNEIDPENPYISQAWGLLEQREGNTEKARELFRKTVALRPHVEVCSAWAILEAREGNMERARELFQQGLARCELTGSGAANVYRSWAEMEERMGDLRRASGLLNKAISSHPQMVEAYIGLANLEARRGCTERALELMATAEGLSERPPASVFNAWAQIELTHRGKLDEARELLQRGYRIHPLDPVCLQSLGIVEDKSGNTDAARKWFEKSVDVRPTAPAFVAWALLEEREGNLDEAKRLFEEALTTDAAHGAAYNAYGMMEARRGRLEDARKVYERGLKVFASSSVWHGYGQLELKLGRNPDRARELFRKGVAQTREDTSFIWHTWGMLEVAEKNVKDARRVFRDALKRYPQNSRILVGAALAEAASCHRTGADETAARDLFKRAVVADPTHAHAWQAWGVFELRRGREDAGQALFRRGLRLCPTHGALWQAWGVLETLRGDFAKARKLFDRGVASCPKHVHLYQAWACMEVRAGNSGRARELLNRALEINVNHGAVWNAYGLLEARHGTLASARQVFMTGIRRCAGHAPLYRAFGQMESHAGNFDRARELFREGLRVDPRHAPLYHTLAKLEGMLGNLDALSKLKLEAEKYFGSEAEGLRAMNNGGEGSIGRAGDDGEDEVQYGALTTPMEAALKDEGKTSKGTEG